MEYNKQQNYIKTEPIKINNDQESFPMSACLGDLIVREIVFYEEKINEIKKQINVIKKIKNHTQFLLKCNSYCLHTRNKVLKQTTLGQTTLASDLPVQQIPSQEIQSLWSMSSISKDISKKWPSRYIHLREQVLLMQVNLKIGSMFHNEEQLLLRLKFLNKHLTRKVSSVDSALLK